jgi:hypothetical protein
MTSKRADHPSPSRTSSEYDLTVVEAMAAEIKDYLLAEVLYWQLSPDHAISPPPPLLTIGGYLFRVQRLEALRPELSPVQRDRLEATEKSFRQTTLTWAVHADQHIDHELKARLDSWHWFVEDCAANEASCTAYYPTEAELRTIIALLFEAGTGVDLSAHADRLEAIDANFREWFKPGDFVWQKDLQVAFPADRYWWLYGRPEFPHRK